MIRKKKPFIIAIAGGSGSGKSTLAYKLQELDPIKSIVLHLDDYNKPRANKPVINGVIYHDHPEALKILNIIHDVNALKSGKSISLQTKNTKDNPNYILTKKKIKKTYYPSEFIIVEGFLALHYPALRKLFDLSIYLKSNIEETVNRRKNPTDSDSWYIPEVVIPMHKKYIEPSAAHATYIIETDDKDIEEVKNKALNLINERLISNI